MSSNDTQVGGTHYASTYQHWDFVVDMGFGYFEAQISRYVTRHRKKHGLQDLRKAEHMAAKLCELVAANHPGVIRAPGHTFSRHYIYEFLLEKYCVANGLNPEERGLLTYLLAWNVDRQLSRAEDVRGYLHRMVARATKAGELTDTSEPQPHGYVDQG